MVNRFDYLLREPERTDVIVFEDPRYRQSPIRKTNALFFVKRVIGTPGEKIEIIEKKVYVNGNPILEDYTKPVDSLDKSPLPSLDTYRSLPPVDDESCFVMGDNRENSTDSRVWGCVPYGMIVGRASFIWYPFSRIRWFH
jgi:signal peptidase I